MSPYDQDGDWPVSFEAHQREQTVRIARETTPQQRLEWLEAAIEFAAAARQARRVENPVERPEVAEAGSESGIHDDES